MTATSSSSSAVESARLGAVTPTPPPPVEGLAELGKAQREVIAQMVPQAKDAGIALIGPDGLLKALTAQIVETALAEELNERLGYDEHDPAGRGRGNSRNGTRSKTVITDNVGSSRSRYPETARWSSACWRKGLTTGEVAAHFAEVCGTSVSTRSSSKVRDGQVRNQPYYAAIGVNLDGHKESAKFWPQLPNRAEEPQRQGRVLHGLRRAQRLAGQHREGVQPSEGPNLFHSPVAQRFRLRVQEAALARDRVNLKPIYETPGCGDCRGCVRRVRREVGQGLPGDDPALAQCLDRVRAAPGPRHRDPQGPVRYERDQKPECLLPQGCLRPRSLPERAGRVEDALPDREIVGPQGHRTDPLGHALEAHPEHPRHHLR